MVFLFDGNGNIDMFAGTATEEMLPTEGEMVAARITLPKPFMFGHTFRAKVLKSRSGEYIAAYVETGAKPV